MYVDRIDTQVDVTFNFITQSYKLATLKHGESASLDVELGETGLFQGRAEGVGDVVARQFAQDLALLLQIHGVLQDLLVLGARALQLHLTQVVAQAYERARQHLVLRAHLRL